MDAEPEIDVVMAVPGAAALVLKQSFHGPLEEFVYLYAGNFSVSFALYFAAINATGKYARPRLLATSATPLAVEFFEITNGFGVMTNVFDRFDLLANAAGIGIAFLVDAATTRLLVPANG